MNNNGKTIGYIVLIILDVLLVFCYSLAVQFGWNQILTTIVSVNTISFAQSFGLILVSDLLFKGLARTNTNTNKDKKEDYLEQQFEYTITQYLNLGFVYGLMWIVTLFI
jgi:hypothetical protein